MRKNRGLIIFYIGLLGFSAEARSLPKRTGSMTHLLPLEQYKMTQLVIF